MLGGADNPNGELLSYIIGADTGDFLIPASAEDTPHDLQTTPDMKRS